MTPAQIKNITLGIIAALILLSGWGMNIWTAHEFKSYKDSITEQVSINEANKQAKEAKDAKVTQGIKDQYDADVARLNDRLQSATDCIGHAPCSWQVSEIAALQCVKRPIPPAELMQPPRLSPQLTLVLTPQTH